MYKRQDDIVEKIGVEKARNAADAADLIIYVVDGSDVYKRQVISSYLRQISGSSG